jgi:hypothetical protein
VPTCAPKLGQGVASWIFSVEVEIVFGHGSNLSESPHLHPAASLRHSAKVDVLLSPEDR